MQSSVMPLQHLPAIRSLFPGLSIGSVMLDNAGESHVGR
jgi:hypothetical protein